MSAASGETLLVIGHRGAAAHAPENTLAGLAAAARLDLRWIEVDTRLTADGALVLMHDASLERTSDGAGLVIERRLEQLAGLDAGSWFGAAFAGEPIPELGVALRRAAALGLRVNLEVKAEAPHERASARAVARALEQLEAAGGQLPLVSSLVPEVLAELQRVAPWVIRGLILERVEPGFATLYQELGCSALMVGEAGLGADDVAVLRAHAPGAPLWAWTVNDAERAGQLAALGVDGVFSDAPERLRALD